MQNFQYIIVRAFDFLFGVYSNLCLFFGQRPYSPVNVVGEIEGDPMMLAKVGDGDAVRVEYA